MLRVAAAVLAAVVALLLVPHGPPDARAQAAEECAALGTPGDFSVFVRDDYASSNTQVDGRVFAGGDATVSGWAVGVAGTPDPGRVDLLVGGNLTANGTQAPNGSVRYGGTFTGQLATPNGTLAQAPLPFDTATELDGLEALADRTAALAANGTASAPDAAGAITLRGSDARRNVFVLTAEQLGEAREVLIRVPTASTTVITVLGDDVSTAVPNPVTQVAYWNGSGYQQLGDAPPPALAALRDATLWNLPQATRVQIGPGVAWPGSVLAPRADVELTGNTQLYGQLWATSLHGQGTSRTGSFSGCLPPAAVVPGPDIELAPTCRDAAADTTTMRLRNRSEETVDVRWSDERSTQSGRFAVRPRHDRYFVVADGRAPHEIVARSGSSTVRARSSTDACAGTVVVGKAVAGPSPGGTWTIVVAGQNRVRRSVAVGNGQRRRVRLPGRVAAGQVPIGAVPGGVRYVVSEPDPRGAATVAVDRPVVTIRDGDLFRATVTNTYASSRPDPGTDGDGDPEPPAGPHDPFAPADDAPGGAGLPLGTPTPPAGPPLVVGAPGADLAITERIDPSLVRLGAPATARVVVRNLGPLDAHGTVARELPRLDPTDLNQRARVLAQVVASSDPQFDIDAVSCTARRPIRCALGTLRAGARVTISVRGALQVGGALQSTTVVTSTTPDPNGSNNVAAAGVRVLRARPAVGVAITAPRVVRVGQRFAVRVVATGGAPTGASAVRICHPLSRDLLVTGHPGATRRGRALCRDVRSLRPGQRAGFVVRAIARRTTAGTLERLRASADAIGLPRPARDATTVRVLAGLPDGRG